MSEPTMREPQRIQRKRTKGWRMPKGAVYVGRPTKWGNPFIVTPAQDRLDCVNRFLEAISRDNRVYLEFYVADIEELRGKALACWCPLDQPCHADVLLEIANRPAAKGVNGRRRA